MYKEKTNKDRFLLYAFLVMGYFVGQHSPNTFRSFITLTIIFCIDMAIGKWIGNKINKIIEKYALYEKS